MADAVFKDLTAEHKLKHVETTDKSAPVIEGGVQVKKVDRGSFLAEVAGDHKLNHADTVDKSAPALDGATVKKNDHAGLFAEIAQKKKE